ncbi:MAG TPA: hypothetical protein PLV45_09780 [bacterium]|nr:hypothetical protein [bacterium]
MICTMNDKRSKELYSVLLLMLFITLGMLMYPAFTQAGDDDDRWEYKGIIHSRPADGLEGEWTIGNRTFTTDSQTEFDQTEGNLKIGGCAKVSIRNGRVHEIDSEPMHDCSE